MAVASIRNEKALSIIPRLKTFLVFLLPKNRRELGGYRYREKQQLYQCLEVVQKPKLDASELGDAEDTDD